MSVLREPEKPETRIGWWFMRTFRSAEVARRTARNRVVKAAYLRACNPESDEAHVALVEALDALAADQSEGHAKQGSEE